MQSPREVHLPGLRADQPGAGTVPPDPQTILDAIRKRWPLIKHVFADGAYDRRKLMEKAAFLDFTVEIVRRTDQGFAILPRRWVVERTFGWMTRYRRLVRDYEARIDVSEAMINLAMANSILRRITHP